MGSTSGICSSGRRPHTPPNPPATHTSYATSPETPRHGATVTRALRLAVERQHIDLSRVLRSHLLNVNPLNEMKRTKPKPTVAKGVTPVKPLKAVKPKTF
jgi:hypothetical protein